MQFGCLLQERKRLKEEMTKEVEKVDNDDFGSVLSLDLFANIKDDKKEKYPDSISNLDLL